MKLNKTAAFLDYLDCMITIIDYEYNVVYINNKTAETFSIDRENSIGQKCHKTVWGNDQPCSHCMLCNAIDRGIPKNEHARTINEARFYNEKLEKWFSGKAAAIRWVDGSIVLFYYLIDENNKQKYEAGLRNAALEVLGKIYRSGDMLLDIVNDILDLSKIEAGKLELAPAKYETASLINDSVRLNMTRFEDRPIKFELIVDETVPSMLYGDKFRIKQILNNLFSNADKLTTSGKVVLSVSAEFGGGNDGIILLIKVLNTGQGMTAEQISKFFNDYAWFNIGSSLSIKGACLGMSITRNLINLMNGEMSVRSEPGKDSEFTVRLPQGNTFSGNIHTKDLWKRSCG